MDMPQIEITKDLSGEVLIHNRQVRFTVASSSMVPMLQPGDQVTVARFPGEAYTKGDLVVFHQSGDQVIHRLLEIDQDGLCLAKGDNAFFCDPAFKLEDILGRVVSISHGQKEIDLNTPGWHAFNQLMGWIGKLENSFLALARLHQPQPNREVDPSETKITDNHVSTPNKNNLGLHLLRVLRSPYRLLLRLFLKIKLGW